MLKNKSNTDTSKDQVLTAPDKVTIVRQPDIQSYIMDSLMPQNDVSTSKDFSDIFYKVNTGVSALFVDVPKNPMLSWQRDVSFFQSYQKNKPT